MTYTFTFLGKKHDIQTTSYEKAIKAIPNVSDRSITTLLAMSSKASKGGDGRSYRSYWVVTHLKTGGGRRAELLTVYGGYSGKSLIL